MTINKEIVGDLLKDADPKAVGLVNRRTYFQNEVTIRSFVTISHIQKGEFPAKKTLS